MRAQPVLYYDLSSPSAYLALERVVAALGAVPELEPILLAAIPGAAPGEPWAQAPERGERMAALERRAAELGLLALRWPPDWPTDTAAAMRAATYAKGIGKVAAFSLAAFRQAFAGGRDLAEADTVLLAAAACEIHPAAVLKALDLASVAAALDRATAAAAAAGVRVAPTVRVGDELFAGERELERAAAALAARA